MRAHVQEPPRLRMHGADWGPGRCEIRQDLDQVAALDVVSHHEVEHLTIPRSSRARARAARHCRRRAGPRLELLTLAPGRIEEGPRPRAAARGREAEARVPCEIIEGLRSAVASQVARGCDGRPARRGERVCDEALVADLPHAQGDIHLFLCKANDAIGEAQVDRMAGCRSKKRATLGTTRPASAGEAETVTVP